jgi:hypothetical protein
MPPDPILALLSVVGLFLYGGIGSVVGVVWVKKCCQHKDLSKIARWENQSDECESFIASVIFWPFLAVPLLVMGVGFGPAKLVKHLGSYLAAALDK